MVAEERVTCPVCKTDYWVEKKYLADPSARLKCSHCKSVFSYSDSLRSSRSPKKSRPPKREEPPLFDDHGKGTDSDRSELTEEGGEENDEPRPRAEEPAARPAKRSEPATRTTHDESDFVFGSTGEWDLGDGTPVEPLPRPSLAERRRRETDEGAKVRAVVILLAIVVAAYAAFAATLVSQPDKAQRMVQQIPLIGRGLSEERLYARRVQLVDVRASAQELRGGRPALVVTGRAVNRNPVPLRDVQILSSLVDSHGQVRDQKRVFCGNVVTVRMLRDLNAQEISMLQQNPPSREFVLRPGAAAEFVVVFFNDGKDVAEARVEVASVRRQP